VKEARTACSLATIVIPPAIANASTKTRITRRTNLIMEFAKCAPHDSDALSLDSTCCSSSTDDSSEVLLDMTVEFHCGAAHHNDCPSSLQAYRKSAIRRGGLRAEKREGTVSFAQDVAVRLYDETSPKQSRWLSSSELKRMRGQNVRSVMVLRLLQKHTSDPKMTKYIRHRAEEAGSPISENTSIGAEHYLERGCVSRINERRDRIRRAVFRAQKNGIEDPEAVASACRQLSEHSRQRAEVLGRLHSQDI